MDDASSIPHIVQNSDGSNIIMILQWQRRSPFIIKMERLSYALIVSEWNSQIDNMPTSDIRHMPHPN